MALGLQLGLFGATAARRALAVPAIQLVDHLHARGHDLAERRDAPFVEARVVGEVDEELRRPRTGRPRLGERHESSLVALLDRVVLNRRVAPGGLDPGVAVDPDLRHEAVDHAEKAAVVVEPATYQVVEPIGAARRPRAVDRHDERPLAGLELRLERLGRFLGERGRVLQLRLRKIERLLGEQRHRDRRHYDRHQRARHLIAWTRFAVSGNRYFRTILTDIVIGLTGLSPGLVVLVLPIFSTTSMPSVTSPKTVCLPVRWFCGASVMKN